MACRCMCSIRRGGQPDVLPQILTENTLLSALKGG